MGMWKDKLPQDLLENHPLVSKKLRKTLIRAGLSGALVVVLLWNIRWAQVKSILLHARWVDLGVPVACFWAGFALSTLRWQTITYGLGLSLSFSRAWKLNLKGFFWNNFLVSSIGGDGYRLWQMLGDFPNQRSQAAVSVFLDRFYGYLALLGVHLALVFLFWRAWMSNRILMVLEVGILGGVVLLGVLGLGLRFLRLSPSTFLSRWPRFLKQGRRFWDIVRHLPRGVVVCSLLYSTIFVVLNGVAWWFYLRALQVIVPFNSAIYASTLAAVVGVLPVSLNGLGITEAGLVLALAPWGVAREEVLMAAFLLRVINALMGLPGGILYAIES